jgi:hypothetical protein
MVNINLNQNHNMSPGKLDKLKNSELIIKN